tara:strand:+ start:1010 stop:1204 length:195 start_codon:yes stop_codon:yes gene_type:complete
MDDAQKIDNLIQIMIELKSVCKQLEDPRNDIDVLIGTMIAMIICVEIPDVTILPTNNNLGIAMA